jgi:hypothetical protein
MDEELFERHSIRRHPVKGHVLYLQKGTEVNGPTVGFSNITCGGEIYSSYGANQEMLVVPFQPGRLLQFDGELLHAVPRPADLWMHPIMEKLIHDPPSTYGRSVILFNLWNEPSPAGLEFTNASTLHTEQVSHHYRANPKLQWKQAPIINDWQEKLWEAAMKPRYKFQLPLMGNVKRRGTHDLSLQLTSTDLVKKALVTSANDT